MKLFKEVLPKATLLVVIFTVLCGFVYPAVVTSMSQVVFKEQANGSIIEVEGMKYGSALLGQQYQDETHMWGRIMNIDTESFTDEEGNPVMYAWASNKSPASEAFEALVVERMALIRKAHPEAQVEAVPVDLVTCSGSGLDPHISVAAADYQVERIAKARNISVDQVKGIIDKCTDKGFMGIFGETVVNVLKVNLMLDGILK